MRSGSRLSGGWLVAVVFPLVAALMTYPGLASATPGKPSCVATTHFVSSWTASPTDAISPLDASGGVVPVIVRDQTMRMVVTPHLGGDVLRIRLSNRYGVSPIRFAGVSVGTQMSGAAVTSPVSVTFGGQRGVEIPAGADQISDPVRFTTTSMRPIAVSMHVAGVAGPPTKHWNANATSFYSTPGSGDLTRQSNGRGFASITRAWMYVSAVDVAAPRSTGAVVAFGDSITDGFVGSTPLSVPAAVSVADTESRYPDFLQRRLDAISADVSVVNAGIGSNRLLAGSEPLFPGAAGLARLERDALSQSGVRGLIVQEGIDDLGLPPTATADQVIAGYTRVIDLAHRRGVKVWLGTLLPASDAIPDGVITAPGSERSRRQVNSWIRTQRLSDGVIDFDRVMRNPLRPSTLAPSLASVDRLHPNASGYRAMGEAVDLDMITDLGPADGGCEARQPS